MPIHGGRTYSVAVTYVKAAGRSEDEDDKIPAFRKEFFNDWIPEVRTVAEVWLPKSPTEIILLSVFELQS